MTETKDDAALVEAINSVVNSVAGEPAGVTERVRAFLLRQETPPRAAVGDTASSEKG